MESTVRGSDGSGPPPDNNRLHLRLYNWYSERQRRKEQTKHKSHLGFRFGKILIIDGASSTSRQIATILNKKGHYQIHALYPPGYFPASVPPAGRKRLIYPVDKMHFLKPVSEHRNYLTWYDSVVDICEEHRIHYIIPQHDTMAIFAANLEHLKERGIYVHTPRLTSIHTIVDKLAMYRMLKDLQILHHPWVFLGKETNGSNEILQAAAYVKGSDNFLVTLTDRTEGSDSVHVRIETQKDLEDFILLNGRKGATEYAITAGTLTAKG